MYTTRLKSLLAILAASLFAGGCSSGYPLKLHSNPGYATVCWHAIDGWACQETPYTVYFPEMSAPLSACFETTPFQFTWQSGAQLTTGIKVCPGNTYFVANRPELPNFSYDVAYATNRSQEQKDESSGWVEVLGNAAESWNKGVEQAKQRERETMDCDGRINGNSVDLECD